MYLILRWSSFQVYTSYKNNCLLYATNTISKQVTNISLKENSKSIYTNISLTLLSNFEYLSVSCLNKSEGGTFFRASFSAFNTASTQLKVSNILSPQIMFSSKNCNVIIYHKSIKHWTQNWDNVWSSKAIFWHVIHLFIVFLEVMLVLLTTVLCN